MIQKRKTSKARILIVENEPVLARDLKQSLNRMGYQVVGVVPTRKEAIQWITSIPVDLVLIDIQLRKKTGGIHASKDIQSRFNVPVVFLSDVPEEKVLEEIRETTSYGFLLKPHKDAELESEIEIALSQHNRQNQLKQQEERFRMALMNSGYGVVLTDERGIIVFVNPAGMDLIQPEKKKVVGKALDAAIRLSDREKTMDTRDILEPLLNHGESVILDSCQFRTSGAESWVDIEGACDVLNLSEEVSGMVMIFRKKPQQPKSGG